MALDLRSLPGLLLVAAVACSSLAAQGVTRRFEGGGGDDRWENPANWNPPGTPNSNDDVVIPAGKSVTIPRANTANGQTEVKSLTVDGTLTGRGDRGTNVDVNIEATETITVTGTVRGAAGSGANGGDGGKVELEAGGDIDISGTVTGGAPDPARPKSGGSIEIESTGGDVSNSGTLEAGTSTNGAAGPKVRVEGTNIDNSGTMTGGGSTNGVGGSVELEVPTRDRAGEGEMTNSGSITGGDGGDSASGTGDKGGDVVLKGNSATNDGTMTGGAGGDSGGSSRGGQGGDVDLRGVKKDMTTNRGIHGGAPGADRNGTHHSKQQGKVLGGRFETFVAALGARITGGYVSLVCSNSITIAPTAQITSATSIDLSAPILDLRGIPAGTRVLIANDPFCVRAGVLTDPGVTLATLSSPPARTCWSLGTVLDAFASPALGAPVGLEHDGVGNLLYTAVGTIGELGVHDVHGMPLGSPWIPSNSTNPIGITSDGSFHYVTDTYRGVDVYDPSGTWQRSFSVSNETTFPEGITFDPGSQLLYVVDGTFNNAVHCYDLSGNPVASYPLNGTSNDGIAFDPDTGTFWVYDSGTDTCRNYDSSFQELRSFPGTRAAGYGSGEGVAIVDGRLYVCATGSRTVVVFDLTGTAAIAEANGSGCPGSASQAFYELFAAGSADLAGRSLRCTPNNESGFDVSWGGSWDPNFANALALSDDSLSGPHALGFSFPVPGSAATTAIDVCSNGFAWLQSGSSSSAATTPSATSLLNSPARIAALWMDLNPAAAGSGSVYFDTFPTHAMVTWDRVYRYGGTSSADAHSVQLQFYPDGEFVLAYRALGNAYSQMVGFSPGPGTTDPGNSDLTAAVPFHTSDRRPLTLAADTRPVLGSTIHLITGNVPTNSLGLGLRLGLSNPVLDLTPLGMPGCTLLSDGELTTLPVGPSGVTTLPIPSQPGLLGFPIPLQSFAMAPGINAAGIATSNGVTLVAGPF